MDAINVQIVRFVASDQPGWVECVLRDAADREWMFTDKIPVFTQMSLDAGSLYPQPGVIVCEILRQWTDPQGRARCTINTKHPWGVSAKDGGTQFEVFADQIIKDAS